jgi:hypothetical protein
MPQDKLAFPLEKASRFTKNPPPIRSPKPSPHPQLYSNSEPSSYEIEQRYLHLFDVNMNFGPAIGITRRCRLLRIFNLHDAICLACSAMNTTMNAGKSNDSPSSCLFSTLPPKYIQQKILHTEQGTESHSLQRAILDQRSIFDQLANAH